MSSGVVLVGKNTKAIRKPFTDLSISEVDFVYEYVSLGGRGVEALKRVKPHLTESTVNTEVSRYLGKLKIKLAIEQLLEERYLNKGFIVSKFTDLAQRGEKEETQFNATRELGRILGLYTKDEGGGNGANINVTFNLPGAARGHVDKPIDAEYTEKEPKQ